MKRLFIILITVLLSVSLFAQQNTFKYEIRANGGLRVGSSVFPKIDSITLQAGKLRIMSGATLQKIAGHVLEADTAAMLSHYALKSDINILSTRVDSIVHVLADSINIETLLQIDFDTDTVASLSDVRSLAGSGGSVDSSLYVTVTRLTDSLDVMRVLINDLIAVVENLGVDLSAPSIDSVEIGNFADDILVIYFSEKMDIDSIPASSVFYLTEGTSEMGIASISFPSDTVMYAVLDSTAAYGSTYLLDYTRAHPYLQDSAGNALANFSNRAVTNYIAAPEAGPPSFLTSDGYTFTWVEAKATNLTLSGTQVTAINDKGPNNHDWTGQGTPGTQWDSANEELDFTNGSAAGLFVSSAPTTMPVTVYMVVRLADWADGHALFYFSLPNTRINQGGSTPEVLLFAGQYNLFEATDLNAYGIITATINGANSSIQWNDDTPVTGNAGTNTLDGTYYIGYDADNANMSIKEVIVRNTTESAQNITAVKAYLYSKYSITP